ncbi:hypothetical protein ACQ86B_14275 [Mycolicibacterium aichiense]|uniref:hypothetical protein n=1 Tax=Mycolicibacterium aichiense TaxID=1799 RepID=UPI003D679CA1
MTTAHHLRGGVTSAVIAGVGYVVVTVAAAAPASAAPQCNSSIPSCDDSRSGHAILASVTPAPVMLVDEGTAEHPNGGLLIGNGYSPDPATCGNACNGGNGGRLVGDGGEGANGGRGAGGTIAGRDARAGNPPTGSSGGNGGIGGRGGRPGDPAR